MMRKARRKKWVDKERNFRFPWEDGKDCIIQREDFSDVGKRAFMGDV